jgi:hypothetical protein
MELYLFSDGVYETHRNQDRDPLASLVDFLITSQGKDGRTIAEVRQRTLEHLHGAPPPDDCSVLKISLARSVENATIKCSPSWS